MLVVAATRGQESTDAVKRWLASWFARRALVHAIRQHHALEQFAYVTARAHGRHAAWCMGVAYLLSGRTATFQNATADYERNEL